MFFLRKSGSRFDLAVSMVGVRMGDRLLQIGSGDGGLFAALAGKVGLTGRACAIDEDGAVVARAQRAAAAAGVLAEIVRAPYDRLPFDRGAFDLVVVREVLPALRPEQRVACLCETLRVLRPGGRCVAIETAPRGGLGALLAPKGTDPRYAAAGGAVTALEAEGFRATRLLTEREGLIFIEGVKPG